MMDACLNFSFFSRDSQGNIIGLDSNLGWHNESKGVLMINHYYKENIDYDAQIAKFGKEILELDKDAEINNEEDEGDDTNFLISKKKHKKTTTTKEKDYRYTYVYGNKANQNYIL